MESHHKEIPIIPRDEDFDDEPSSRKPGLLTVIITLLLVLAILSTLIWPLLQIRHHPPITPTLSILQEA